MQFVKALADLRRGQFPSAAEWSARCLANPSTIPPCQAGVRFIQAMAFARLHRTDEARSTYQAGKKLMASAGDYTTGNFEGYWVVWAIADLLQHETDAVLKPPAPPARP